MSEGHRYPLVAINQLAKITIASFATKRETWNIIKYNQFSSTMDNNGVLWMPNYMI